MNNYFRSIQNYDGWLLETPKKADVLNNAKIEGKSYILNDSNNRAIVTESDNAIYLQSYDTLILKFDKATKTLVKLWNGYSKTTQKHINTFLQALNVPQMNKKRVGTVHRENNIKLRFYSLGGTSAPSVRL